MTRATSLIKWNSGLWHPGLQHERTGIHGHDATHCATADSGHSQCFHLMPLDIDDNPYLYAIFSLLIVCLTFGGLFLVSACCTNFASGCFRIPNCCVNLCFRCRCCSSSRFTAFLLVAAGALQCLTWIGSHELVAAAGEIAQEMSILGAAFEKAGHNTTHIQAAGADLVRFLKAAEDAPCIQQHPWDTHFAPLDKLVDEAGALFDSLNRIPNQNPLAQAMYDIADEINTKATIARPYLDAALVFPVMLLVISALVAVAVCQKSCCGWCLCTGLLVMPLCFLVTFSQTLLVTTTLPTTVLISDWCINSDEKLVGALEATNMSNTSLRNLEYYLLCDNATAHDGEGNPAAPFIKTCQDAVRKFQDAFSAAAGLVNAPDSPCNANKAPVLMASLGRANASLHGIDKDLNELYSMLDCSLTSSLYHQLVDNFVCGAIVRSGSSFWIGQSVAAVFLLLALVTYPCVGNDKNGEEDGGWDDSTPLLTQDSSLPVASVVGSSAAPNQTAPYHRHAPALHQDGQNVAPTAPYQRL